MGLTETHGFAMGQVSALINDILPAKTIVEGMVEQAATIMRTRAATVNAVPKL